MLEPLKKAFLEIPVLARRHWTRLQQQYKPTGRPSVASENAVLQDEAEIEAAIAELNRLGLPLYHGKTKNWDSLLALGALLRRTTPEARILDAGSDKLAVILPWLALYGYRRLEGNNLAFTRTSSVGPITYGPGDVTKMSYPDASFDAVTCMSVIEHGVDVEAYVREMSRVLRPGGLLITSTDYWETPIDTTGKTAFGAPVRVFDKQGIEGLVASAQRCGLHLTGSLDLTCKDRAVTWKRVDLRFTFVNLTFEKR